MMTPPLAMPSCHDDGIFGLVSRSAWNYVMRFRNAIAGCALVIAAVLSSAASAQLTPALQRSMDAVVAKALEDASVPSVSIAIVKDGKLVYAKAYGVARLDTGQAANAGMRYKIGSNTKQFVAAAVLLLAQEGRLSLDDKVARFLPELARARDVTIRQLLSHTAGYVDYYPLDYLASYMVKPTTVQAILDGWGKRPLGFEPGTRWEYSNTGYVIAGRIVEIASGLSLEAFLRSRITDRLGMHSAIDTTAAAWDVRDPQGYDVAALGPPRPAIAEGRNWVWAAGNLAMTASDLARWDIALMHDTLLSRASRKEMSTETLLANGTGTHYGLGLFVRATDDGRLRWDHGGEASGFRSQNTLFPDDDVAIVVLTNGSGATSDKVTADIESLLFQPANDTSAAAALDAVRALFAGLQDGHPDRRMMTPSLDAYFSDAVVADFATSLKSLGSEWSLTQTRMDHRGGLVYRFFKIKSGGKTVGVSTYFAADGKLEQFLVYPR